ncbi:PepSY-associated TM helix domain-containing protein [Streptomyces sp. B1866]|uniref:PepSY-associated TM helix domain-containing protein n=1 Tax=Streptomyces sp. B1866 TaxID=3075431 RepID=UPI00288EACA7|nr:PepSY-associated TM helix domain-containing protein [Streptomyces sp. B1866]MDT3397283.1 PepSY-associated TM helix domain-containing protein [Streptomyces sp. B1866]
MVVLHRWSSLVLGLVLLVVTTSGAILLYQPEYFRATHHDFYRHTPSAHPVTADQAVDIVRRAHPDFPATWVNSDHGIYEVGGPDYNAMYGVDPGTGEITGLAHRNGGSFGFLANLHECALNCADYPGYIPQLAEPFPTLGISWLRELTWGGVILGVLGLLLLLLALTGIATWWPGLRRLSQAFRIRTGRGRFARDYDLHRVVGAVAVPFLLMWAVTGAAFEFPVVEKSWLAITGGSGPDEHRYQFTAAPAAQGTPEITLAQASAAALDRVPGRVTRATLPTEQTPYYGLNIARSYDPYAHEMFRGDGYVYVDAHDARHVKVASGGPQPAANAFYDRYLEPAHFGWQVNGWWRIIWAAFGLSPLLLAVTGVSTWLIRRRSRKAKKAAARRHETARAAARRRGPTAGPGLTTAKSKPTRSTKPTRPTERARSTEPDPPTDPARPPGTAPA